VAGRPRRAVSATLGVVLGTLAVYLIAYFIAAPQSLPRHLIVFFALIAAALLSLWRGVFALALGAGPLARRVAVVGQTASARPLLQAVREHTHAYYNVVAVFDPSAYAESAPRALNVAELDEVIVSAEED